MIDDVSISSSMDSITLGEISEKKKEEASIICDWDPCGYKSKDRESLINHIDDHIGKKDNVEKNKDEAIVIDDLNADQKELYSVNVAEQVVIAVPLPLHLLMTWKLMSSSTIS